MAMHGQIEIREYYQTEDIKWLNQKKNWKGLKSIVMEKKTIKKEEGEIKEYRYFISSLKANLKRALEKENRKIIIHAFVVVK